MLSNVGLLRKRAGYVKRSGMSASTNSGSNTKWWANIFVMGAQKSHSSLPSPQNSGNSPAAKKRGSKSYEFLSCYHHRNRTRPPRSRGDGPFQDLRNLLRTLEKLRQGCSCSV